MIGLLPALILLMLPGPSVQEARLLPSQVMFYLAVLEADPAAKLLPGGAKAKPSVWQPLAGAKVADLSAPLARIPVEDERISAPLLLAGTVQPRDGPTANLS